MINNIGSIEKAFTNTFHINIKMLPITPNMTKKKVPMILVSPLFWVILDKK